MKSQGILYSSTQPITGQQGFLFSLRSFSNKTNKLFDITLDFHPQFNTTNQASSDISFDSQKLYAPSSLLPQFNDGTDVKVHAFVSQVHKKQFQQENKTIINGIAVRSERKNIEHTQVSQPIPRSKYCRICKEHFSDYLNHLKHPIHVKKFEAQCKKVSMIDDLIKKLQQQTHFRKGKARQRVTQEQLKQEGKPCKIRVIQIQQTLTPSRLSNMKHTSMTNNIQNLKERVRQW